MRKFLYSIALLVAIAWMSERIAFGQATYNATTCNKSDVQAAITLEQASKADGDIIGIPAGTCVWTGSTPINQNFTNSVTFQGAGAESSTAGGASTTGTDLTIIIDHMTSSNGVQIPTTAGKSFRWTGIAILQNSASTNAHTAFLNIGGASTAVRVDHDHFYSYISGNEPLAIGGSVQGVGDHIYWDALSGIVTFSVGMYNGANWQGDSTGYGDQSWVDTDHFGTSEFFFVEDSRINNGGVGDCTWGGRFVYRYFTALNAQIYSHGLTNGRERGCRAGEVYQGTFTASSAYNVSIAANGGSLLAWGNSSTAFRWLVETNYVRQSNATYTYAAPPNGWGYCGNAQTGSTSAWDQNTSSTTGYRCMDAPAAGAGQLVTGANFPSVVNNVTGTVAWTNQILDPIYVWDNTYATGGFSYSTQGVIGDGTTGPLLTRNTDYYRQFGTYGESGTFNGTAGVGQGLYSAAPSTCTPGVGYWATDQQSLYICGSSNNWLFDYAPYPYPHPLTVSFPTITAPTTPTTGATAWAETPPLPINCGVINTAPGSGEPFVWLTGPTCPVGGESNGTDFVLPSYSAMQSISNDDAIGNATSYIVVGDTPDTGIVGETAPVAISVAYNWQTHTVGTSTKLYPMIPYGSFNRTQAHIFYSPIYTTTETCCTIIKSVDVSASSPVFTTVADVQQTATCPGTPSVSITATTNMEVNTSYDGLTMSYAWNGSQNNAQDIDVLRQITPGTWDCIHIDMHSGNEYASAGWGTTLAAGCSGCIVSPYLTSTSSGLALHRVSLSNDGNWLLVENQNYTTGEIIIPIPTAGGSWPSPSIYTGVVGSPGLFANHHASGPTGIVVNGAGNTATVSNAPIAWRSRPVGSAMNTANSPTSTVPPNGYVDLANTFTLTTPAGNASHISWAAADVYLANPFLDVGYVSQTAVYTNEALKGEVKLVSPNQNSQNIWRLIKSHSNYQLGSATTGGNVNCVAGACTAVTVSNPEFAAGLTGIAAYNATNSGLNQTGITVLTMSSSAPWTFTYTNGSFTGSGDAMFNTTDSSHVDFYGSVLGQEAPGGHFGCWTSNNDGTMPVSAHRTLPVNGAPPQIHVACIDTYATGTVATPSGTPPPGPYSSAQSVALSTSTPLAVICYTLNSTGSPLAATAGTCNPTDSVGSTEYIYSTAISVTVTTTIKALGTLSGYANSAVATLGYTITPAVLSPSGLIAIPH